ncbi:MAG: hypothetical protein AAF235_11855, partial [Planctomycetota bacterium]
MAPTDSMPSPTLAETERIGRATRERVRIAGTIAGGIRGLLVGSGMTLVAAAVVVVMFFAGWAPARWAFGFLVVPAIGLLGGVVFGWMRSVRSLLECLSRVDSSLGLEDRLATGHAMNARASDGDPIAVIAARHAELAARSSDAVRAVPWRVGRSWMVAVGAWLASTGVLLALPRGAADDAEIIGVDIADALAAMSDIADAARLLEEDDETFTDATGSAASDASESAGVEAARALDELRAQLESGNADPAEARARAASVLEDRADAVEEASRADAAAVDQLRDRLASAGRSDDGRSTAADDLVDALAGGNFAAARNAARDLLRSSETLTEAERRAAADVLERAADRIAGNAAADGAGDPEPNLPEDLPDDLAAFSDRDEVAQRLRNGGFSPEAADRIADELEQRRDLERAEGDA